MRHLALLFALWAGAPQAGVAAYEACLGAGYEARVMAKFTERFPHERCSAMAACDPRLLKSAEALVRGQCREAALAECASTKCRAGLEGRWRAEGATLRTEIVARLAALDLAELPALQSRRFSDPARWVRPVGCVGDAAACAAAEAGQALGDLERLHREVMALP